ncbi:hypothetical protein ABZX30_37930, partial [Streptomyces sp. NPDC004542]|uniref:hypothetical protein n=1 Tax=Streptomyces sp. NPDC004542 TaxID=3154281 RepID=UPI0033AFC53B
MTAEPGPVSLLGQEYPVDLHGWLQGVAAGRTALTPQTLQALERTGYTTQGSERLRAAEEAQDDKVGKSGLTVGEVVDHLRRFYQHNRRAKADRLPGSDWTVSAGGRDIYLGRWLGAISRGRVAVAPPTFARLREAGLPEADEILFLPPTPARRTAVDPFHAARALDHYYTNDKPDARGQFLPPREPLKGAGAPDVPGTWFHSVYTGHTGVSVEGAEALIAAGLPTTTPNKKPSAIRRTVSAQALQALYDHYVPQGREPDGPVQDPPADTEFIDASGTSRSLTAYISLLRTHRVQLPKGHGLPDQAVTHLQLSTPAQARRTGIDPFHAARALAHYYTNNKPDARGQFLPSRKPLKGAGAPDIPGIWFHSVYTGNTGVSVEGVEALIAAGLPTTGDQPSAIRRTVSAHALQALRNHYSHQGQEPDAPIQDPPADTEFIDASGTSRSLTAYISLLRTHNVQLPEGHGLPDKVVTHLQLDTHTRRAGIDPFHAARALDHYYTNNQTSAPRKLPPQTEPLTGAGAPDVPGTWFHDVYRGNTGVSVEGVEALLAAGLPTTIPGKPSAIRRTVSAQALQALRDHYAHQGQEPDAPLQDPPADTEFIDASGTSRSLTQYIGLLRTHGVQLPSSHGLPDKVVTHLQLSTPTPARRAGVDPFHAARALEHYYTNNQTSAPRKLPSQKKPLTGAGAPDVPGTWFHDVYRGETGVSVEGVEALIAAGLPTTAAGNKPSAIRRTVSAQALQALRDHYAHQGQEPDAPIQDPPADTEFIDASGTSRSLTAYIGLLRTHGVQLPEGHRLPDKVVTHLQLSTHIRRAAIDPFHAARALRHYYDANPRDIPQLPRNRHPLTGAGTPTVLGKWFSDVYRGTTGVSVEGVEALIAAGLPTNVGNKPSAIRRTVSAQALQALRDHYAHQGQEPDAPIQDPPADTEFIDASGTSRSLNAYIGL